MDTDPGGQFGAGQAAVLPIGAQAAAQAATAHGWSHDAPRSVIVTAVTPSNEPTADIVELLPC
jgi:hypothetical protein